MPSPSRARREADGLSLLAELDPFARLRDGLRRIANERAATGGLWAGIPIPLDDLPLVVEPNYPNAAALMAMGETARKRAQERQEETPDAPDGCTLRNVFYSRKWRCRIVVYEENGKVYHGKIPAVHSFNQQLDTLGASFVWGIEQERAALQTLGGLVRHHIFKQYLLTGCFMETSRRSGLTYFFRKLRPTVVLTERGDEVQILCSLCLHPIGYYDGSWAGAMCPTDDVIAHLMLMRGDEPMLWRRANQHPPWAPEAGL